MCRFWSNLRGERQLRRGEVLAQLVLVPNVLVFGIWEEGLSRRRTICGPCSGGYAPTKGLVSSRNAWNRCNVLVEVVEIGVQPGRGLHAYGAGDVGIVILRTLEVRTSPLTLRANHS